MKNFIKILLFVLLLPLLFSCDDIEKITPTQVSLEITFNGVIITEENPSFYTLNLDEVGNQDGIFSLYATALNVFGEKEPIEKEHPSVNNFTFTCQEDDTFPFFEQGEKGRRISFNVKDCLPGTYTITAKSKNTEYPVSKSYIFNFTSSLERLEVKYEIFSEFQTDNLNQDAIQGVFGSFKKRATLPSNTQYSFEVIDTKNEVPITTLAVFSSNDSVISFIYENSNKGYFLIKGKEGEKATLTFQLPSRKNIKLQVEITLSDESISSLDKNEDDKGKQEDVLSFTANTQEESEKYYTYTLKTHTHQLVNFEPVFSLDAEIWDEEAELDFLDMQSRNKVYTPTPNPNPSWYSKTILTYTRDNINKIKVEVDGEERKVKIYPLANTTSLDGSYNQHFYLYWKWKDENNVIYRGKYRIMVGGILEGISLYKQKGGTKENITQKDIELNTGDDSSFDVLVQYNPSTIKDDNNKVIMYLAKDLTLKTYKLNGKTLSLPTPIDKSTAVGKTIDLQSAIENNTSYILVDERNNDVPISYYAELDMKNGQNTVWTKYNGTGEKCFIIALDYLSGLWTYYTIQQTSSTDHVILSCELHAPTTLKLFKTTTIPTRSFYSLSSKDKNSYGQDVEEQTSEKINTGYNGTEMQKYPNTIQKNCPNSRTFFLKVTEECIIDLETNFEIEDIYIDHSIDSMQRLKIETGIKDNYSAKIYCNSLYNVMNSDEQKDITDKGKLDKYISPAGGIEFNIMLNKDIKIPITLFVYKE